MNRSELWDKFGRYLCSIPELGISLDISRMNFVPSFFEEMEPRIQKAFKEMGDLEAGAVANPDENRMVGHYWLRSPELAPTSVIQTEIKDALKSIQDFTSKVHRGEISPPSGGRFENILIIGIGGSALGPQFISDALCSPSDRMTAYFLDNTDPDGIDRVFGFIGDALPKTLAIVISKSGSTKETRNGMLEAMEAYRTAGLDFSRHAIAVTGSGSELDRLALSGNWLARFPMWDWVGGRTSVTSAVGLIPAALQGIDITGILEGARICDRRTRCTDTASNPAALMALMWHYATNGRGEKDMVMLPYKDRLLLFSRYLQQLIMESLGKEFDTAGNVVNQGLTVYGNKGSTDQHAYVQQLREGIPNFFVTFIEVLNDRSGKSIEVETGVTSGDYLFGFMLGSREALYEKGRESMTITVDNIDARTVGALIALYERTVGLYASLVSINAYHQPGVEAGKKAAGTVITIQFESVAYLKSAKTPQTAMQIAAGIGKPDHAETIYQIMRHLSANEDRKTVCSLTGNPRTDTFFISA